MKEHSIRVTRRGRDTPDVDLSTGPDGPSRWYLLFAGTEPVPRGGLADLVQTFSSDETARNAFREIRLANGSAGSWAQLAVVDAVNGIQPLCWFGIGATPNRSSTLVLTPEASVSRGRARRARRRSSRFQPGRRA